MGLKEWSIGFIIFSLVVTSFVAFSNDLFDNYDASLGSEYDAVYNHIEINIEDESNRTSDMQSKANQATLSDPSLWEQVTLIGGLIVQAVKLPFTTMFGIFTTVNLIWHAMNLGEINFILVGITSIIMITLTVTILAWYFGRRTA